MFGNAGFQGGYLKIQFAVNFCIKKETVCFVEYGSG